MCPLFLGSTKSETNEKKAKSSSEAEKPEAGEKDVQKNPILKKNAKSERTKRQLKNLKTEIGPPEKRPLIMSAFKTGNG